MKIHQSLLLTLVVMCTTSLTAQDEPSIHDFNFESMSTPTFILLDETPTSFSMPDNLKALGLYLSNGFANTNIAVELNPYWVFGWNKEDTSYEQYRGLSTTGNHTRIDPFQRLRTNSSLSVSFVNKEFSDFETPRKTLTIGARVTFVELYSANSILKLNAILEEIGGTFSNEILDAFDGYVTGPIIDLASPDPEVCNQAIASGAYPEDYRNAARRYFETHGSSVQTTYTDASELLKAYFGESCRVSSGFVFNAQNIQPLFRLDGAVGYSWLFKENNFDAATVNRFGSWLTADLALRLSDAQYLHLFGIARYIDDGFQIDTSGAFTTTNFVDYGAKIELELNKFKLSYEYLERSGDGAMSRSVGNVYYQLTKSISITGGFGKDFQADNNLISILGLSWGIDSGESPF